MTKFKLNPLQQFTLFLTVYSLCAIIFNFNSNVLLHLTATLGFGVLLFYVLTAISKKKKSIWNAIATSLIIFLVLHFGMNLSDVIQPLIAVFVAIIYKFFFEYKDKPIINPAVFGILVLISLASVIPGLGAPFVSWWGASFREPVALVLALVWILTGFGVWRKWPMLLSFLIPYAAFVYFTGGMEFINFVFGTGTIYFFTAVMLIEPKTSPIKKNQQILGGLLTAVAYAAFTHYGANNTELLAIATMNLANFGMQYSRSV